MTKVDMMTMILAFLTILTYLIAYRIEEQIELLHKSTKKLILK